MSNIKAYKINQLPRTICTLKSKRFSILVKFMQNSKLKHMQKSKLGFYLGHLVTHAEDWWIVLYLGELAFM